MTEINIAVICKDRKAFYRYCELHKLENLNKSQNTATRNLYEGVCEKHYFINGGDTDNLNNYAIRPQGIRIFDESTDGFLYISPVAQKIAQYLYMRIMDVKIKLGFKTKTEEQ